MLINNRKWSSRTSVRPLETSLGPSWVPHGKYDSSATEMVRASTPVYGTLGAQNPEGEGQGGLYQEPYATADCQR